MSTVKFIKVALRALSLKLQAIHRFLCAALCALRLCILRHGVKKSPLEWTGTCSEDTAKRVAAALLLSGLI
jgi:hypothetical protein